MEFIDVDNGSAWQQSCNTCPTDSCSGTLVAAVYGTEGVHCVRYGVGINGSPTTWWPLGLNTGPRTVPLLTACDGIAQNIEIEISLCEGSDPPYYIGGTLLCYC